MTRQAVVHTVPTRAELEAEAIKTRDAFMASLDMRQVITDMLDGAVQEVVLKILGFDNHWFGKWEVNNTNGKQSPIVDAIKDAAQPAAEEAIRDALKDGVHLTGEQKKSIQKDYRYFLERRVRHLAEAQADAEAASIVDSVLKWKPDEAEAQVKKVLAKALETLTYDEIVALVENGVQQ